MVRVNAAQRPKRRRKGFTYPCILTCIIPPQQNKAVVYPLCYAVMQLLAGVRLNNTRLWCRTLFLFCAICIAALQLSGKKSFLGIAFLFSLWYNTIRWLNGTGSVDHRWGYSTVGRTSCLYCRPKGLNTVSS